MGERERLALCCLGKWLLESQVVGIKKTDDMYHEILATGKTILLTYEPNVFVFETRREKTRLIITAYDYRKTSNEFIYCIMYGAIEACTFMQPTTLSWKSKGNDGRHAS